jgi:hypothetical protein
MHNVYWNRTDARWMFTCAQIFLFLFFLKLKKEKTWRKWHFIFRLSFLVTALGMMSLNHFISSSGYCNHFPPSASKPADWRNGGRFETDQKWEEDQVYN